VRWTQAEYVVTDDPSEMDVDFIHALLRTTYWAEHRSREVVEASFRSSASIPFMGRCSGKPAGFARVVTDRCTFAWVCDVVVHPEHRGKGLAKFLMSCVMAHPDLKQTKMCLATRDAHKLYEPIGFVRREMMWRVPAMEGNR